MLTMNSKVKQSIQNASSDNMPGTYSIPIRTAQHEFIARGQSALLGYKSQHRNLGIARPCWKNIPISTKKIVVKKQREEKDQEDDESD